MRLLIISHTPHYEENNTVVGWGSTVREIDQLAKLFTEITHLAPLHTGPVPRSALPYTASNVSFRAVKPAGGETLGKKLGILWRIPGWVGAMKKEMQQADCLHIRCPAGISLVALLAAQLWARGKPTWVKYAGNWNTYPGQALAYKFQRWYLFNNFHKGVVTVNGRWANQPKHVYTFQNPSFSEKEYDIAVVSARSKQLSLPVKLLFVGRLSRAKGVHRILDIAKRLKEIGLNYDLTLVGDSHERSEFEEFVIKNSLGAQVHFSGWQPMTELSNFYEKAHIFVFPSSSEGWPKVLSEAMAYGVVPIASDIGSIPQILTETSAGLAIPPVDTEAYVSAIIKYTQDETSWMRTSQNGVQAARDFTYEHYLSAVKNLYQQNWQIDLNHG